MNAPFDWQAHNTRLDDALAALRRCDETERQLSQAHLTFAREMGELLKGITA